MSKNTSNVEGVLKALRAAGTRGCLTAELCQPDVGGERFGGRVLELRQAGHNIASAYVRQGSWRYTLIVDAEAGAGPGIAAPSPPAVPLVVTAGVRLGINLTYHACDACGYKFKDQTRPWPTGCPSCQAGMHWINDFVCLGHCEDYIPLCDRERGGEVTDLPIAA